MWYGGEECPSDTDSDEEFHKAVNAWFAVHGDETYRLNYPLTKESIVIDAGGYHGDWTAAIVKRYGCCSHVFEPVPKYAAMMRQRFSDNPNVTVHECGLGADSRDAEIEIENDGSSIYRPVNGHPVIAIKYKSIIEFLQENGISEVQLIKINIEGGEYELLEKLCETGYISRFLNVQVQFHNIPEIDAARRMALIWDRLSKTHKLTWSFRPFVWENWTRK